MSIGAHILRALFIFVGLLAGVGTFAMLVIQIHGAAADVSTYGCGSVLDPTSYDPQKVCDNALQTRAQGAQALGTVALGLFVAAAAVSIGSRHRMTVRSDARDALAPAPPPSPSYSSPGYPPPGAGTAPR